MSKECAECGAISDDTVERCPICASDLPRSVVSETRIKMDRRKVFLTGLNQIRFGVLGLLVQVALIAIVAPAGFDTLTSGFSNLYVNGVLKASYTAGIFDNFKFVAIGLIIIGMIVAFALRAGFSNLSLVNDTYEIGKTGAQFEIAGLFILIFGSYIMLSSMSTWSLGLFHFTVLTQILSNLELSAAILIIGGLLGIVGLVMSATALIRIGVQFGSSTVRIGGILYFIIGFLGSIVLYFGLTKIMKRVTHARRYAKAPKRLEFP